MADGIETTTATAISTTTTTTEAQEQQQPQEQQPQQDLQENKVNQEQPSEIADNTEEQSTVAVTNDNNKREREPEAGSEEKQSKKRKTELLARLKQSVAKTDSVLTKQSKQPSTPTTPASATTAGKTKRNRKPNTKYTETPTLVSDTGKRLMDRQAYRMCFKLLTTLKNHRWAWPFNQPVDPIQLGIPDYLTIIKHPMDLGTIEKKLINEEYSDIHEFAADTRLVWQNCMTYNQPGSDVVRMAEVLRDLFENKFAKIVERVEGNVVTKPQFIETHAETPTSKSLQSKLSKLTGASATPTAISPPTTTKAKGGRRKSSTQTSGSVAAVDTLPETDSRPMTFEELTNLSNQIQHLTSPDLAKVVDIIRSRAPKASTQASSSEIEIELDALDPVTLRMLEAHIYECMAVRRKKAEARSRAAERAAETRRLNKLKKEQDKQQDTNTSVPSEPAATTHDTGSDTVDSGSDTESETSSESDTESEADSGKEKIQSLTAQVQQQQQQQNSETASAAAASSSISKSRFMEQACLWRENRVKQ
jgi:hypothetical protein